MFNKLVSSLSNLSHVLENLFVTILRGLQNITMFVGDAFETLCVFVDVFGYLVFQLSVQFTKVFLIFLPGIIMSLMFISGHWVIGTIGVLWLLILLTAIFGFRPIAKANGSIEEIPDGWLWYFPYHWIKNDDLRPILCGILELNNSINNMGSQSDKTSPLGRSIIKLSSLASRKLKLIRKTLQTMQNRLKRKPSYQSLQFQQIVDKTSLEYLRVFMVQFQALEKDVTDLFQKHKTPTSCDETEDNCDVEIQNQMAHAKLLVRKLDEIECKFPDI